MVPDPIALTVTSALLMGLAFGAGPCNITCLPYLGPVFVAADNCARQAWRVVLPFSLGRLFSYSLLGVIAGSLGQALQSSLESPWVSWLLGGATIAVGVSLLWRRQALACHQVATAANVPATANVSIKQYCSKRSGMSWSLKREFHL